MDHLTNTLDHQESDVITAFKFQKAKFNSNWDIRQNFGLDGEDCGDDDACHASTSTILKTCRR